MIRKKEAGRMREFYILPLTPTTHERERAKLDTIRTSPHSHISTITACNQKKSAE
jgi:hypothetical protein